MRLLYLVFLIFNVYQVHSYFTRPGKCPENIKLQDDFRLAEFYDKWYQAYHYSSDLRPKSNCSILQLQTEKDGVYLNQSRVDLGLFHKYSYGKLEIPTKIEDAARLNVIFVDVNAPRRLATRRYPFHVLATNYKYYATVYTCQYSPLINKHFMYVWILSRNPILNDVSKELAMKPLKELGILEEDLVKDDFSKKCTPKYFEEKRVESRTFNTPVSI